MRWSLVLILLSLCIVGVVADNWHAPAWHHTTPVTQYYATPVWQHTTSVWQYYTTPVTQYYATPVPQYYTAPVWSYNWPFWQSAAQTGSKVYFSANLVKYYPFDSILRYYR